MFGSNTCSIVLIILVVISLLLIKFIWIPASKSSSDGVVPCSLVFVVLDWDTLTQYLVSILIDSSSPLTEEDFSCPLDSYREVDHQVGRIESPCLEGALSFPWSSVTLYLSAMWTKLIMFVSEFPLNHACPKSGTSCFVGFHDDDSGITVLCAAACFENDLVCCISTSWVLCIAHFPSESHYWTDNLVTCVYVFHKSDMFLLVV